MQKLFSLLRKPLWAAGLIMAVANSGSADEPFLHWVPESANAIAVVRVKELLASELAKVQKWSEANRQAYASGFLAAPPWANTVVRATEYRPNSTSSPSTFAVYLCDRTVTIGEIARHEGVKAETLVDRPAVKSNRNVYFTSLAPKMIGSIDPADRQLAAKWIREGAKDQVSEAAAYLQHVFEEFPSAEAIVAADLKDSLSASDIQAWLESTGSFSKDVNLAQLSELFANMQGITIAVDVSADIKGRLEVDFLQTIPQNLIEPAKKAVFQYLLEAGAHLEKVQGAVVRVENNTMVIEGPMTLDGFQRVLGLIRSPHPEASQDQSTSTDSVTGLATLNYYDNVVHIINNLKRQNRQGNDYNSTALWHEKFANQIEQLPSKGVDPEVVAYGYDTSKKLRSLASSLRGVPIEVNQLQNAIRVDYQTTNVMTGATPFGYLYRPGFVNATSNIAQVRSQQADVIAKDQADREQVWLMMRDSQNDIATRMSKKYDMKFETPKF